MGTQKRQRQKANRANKIEEQHKQIKRDLTKDRLVIFALCALAVVAALALWAVFGGESTDAETEVTTVEPAVPTQPLPTQAPATE